MKRHWGKTIVCSAMLVLLASVPVSARDDYQYRQLLTVKLIDTEKVDFVFFGQMRTNEDATNVNFYHMSPKLQFNAFKNLQFGLNYSYINLKTFSKAAGSDEFGTQQRIELEANPHWNVGNLVKVSLRNRYEFRWIEDRGWDNGRLRHRMNFEFPLKGVLPLKSVYMNSEFFYDFHDHRYNENWTTPVGLKFKVTDNVNLSVFYMIINRLSDTWTSAQSLGTHVMISF